MWGRSIYSGKDSFVWCYKVGRGYNLTPARASTLAIALVDNGPVDPECFKVYARKFFQDMNFETSRVVALNSSRQLQDGAALPSRGSRKSVNWAPKFIGPRRKKTTPKQPTCKRSSTRLSVQATASTKPVTKYYVQPKKTYKAKAKSAKYSREETPIFKFRRGGRKRNPSAAETLKELQLESKNVSKDGSKSNKRGRVVFCEKGEQNGPEKHQVDGRRRRESGKGWVSVPLDSLELEGELKACKNKDDANPETVQCSRPRYDIKVVFGHVSDLLQHTVNVLKKDFELGIHDSDYEELRKFYAGAKSVFHEVEQGIDMIRERQLKKVRAEKAEIEATTAAQIDLLSRDKLTLMAEKLRIENDRDSLRNDAAGDLERAREALRVELEREYGIASESMKKELATEQDKNCCQICFTAPRDGLVLPCMHFQYCNDCLQKHQRRSKECPTCRAKISGVLRCNLMMS